MAIINVKSDKDDQKYNATIIGVDDDILSLYISGENLPDVIHRARLIVDDTKLLEGVKNTIQNIKNHEEKPPKVIANALFGIGIIKSGISDYQDFPAGFNASQRETIQKALGSDAIYAFGNKKAILYQWIQYLKTQKHVYLNSISEVKYLM